MGNMFNPGRDIDRHFLSFQQPYRIFYYYAPRSRSPPLSFTLNTKDTKDVQRSQRGFRVYWMYRCMIIITRVTQLIKIPIKLVDEPLTKTHPRLEPGVRN